MPTFDKEAGQRHFLALYDDGIGYVQLLDIMGDEFTPAEDARTSTNKGRRGSTQDAKLQARLLKDNHTSPFEGVVVKFEMVIPLFVRAELDRHRTTTKSGEHEGEDTDVVPDEHMRKWFSRNELSSRYIPMPALYYFPDTVRQQSVAATQGGGEPVAVPPAIAQQFLQQGNRLVAETRELYDWAVAAGIEKGLARIFNPQNLYTKIRYTGSLKNWLDMLALRLKDDVLWECRQVAACVHAILACYFPSVITTWEDDVLYATRLPRAETIAVVQALVAAGVTGPADSVLRATIARLAKNAGITLDLFA